MQPTELRDPRKLEKTRFCQNSWQQELGGLKYIGQTRIGVSFVIRVLQLILQWIDLPLGGRRRGFSLSFLISSWITRLGVILCLHPSSLIFDEYGLQQFYHLFACIYSYSVLSLSQSKSNRAITFNWGSKQALVYSHIFELSIGIRVGALVVISLPKCDPRPLSLLWIVLWQRPT